ncbi:MAG: glycosyltransferase 87 family protein [Micromonosporaceae bacterium]
MAEPRLLTPSWSVRLPGRTVRQVLTVAALAVVVVLFLLALAARHGFFDLRVYYGALNHWVHDGGELYDYYLPKSTYGFTYPPFAALMMLPMTITGWPIAMVISVTMAVLGTSALLYWLVDPIARRQGWTRWYAFAIAACLAAAFEPLRETVNFGQVNLLLVFLVAADLILFVGRGSRLGGLGIGLATAIKLTPGIFIVYLLVTKRWRAALVASATAAAATILAAAVAPDASRIFWTDAVWNTDRVGAVAFISNQSIYGAVARLHPADPNAVLWLLGLATVVGIWLVRVRRAAAAGDELTGFALTGVLGCLMSPITWVHHLVWVGPALILVLDNALATRLRRRRIALLVFFAGAYALLCSRLVWEFNERWDNPVGWLLASSYVWVSIALLVALPIRGRRGGDTDGVPHLGELDRELAGLLDRDRADLAVGDESPPLVEGPRPGVTLQHP